MSARILIAGVGNIFFGDDGYGCEVISRMRDEIFPPDVRVEDYGIRGTHLAFELMSGYEGSILIDAVPKGGPPGTLYVIEPDVEEATGTIDAHTMDLQAVFAFMRTLEGVPPRILIVGCEPAAEREEMGLCEEVEQAVGKTIPLVHEVLKKYFTGAIAQAGGTT
ncbi:MAG: hydrogenase maturation protease [Candidatus Eremiobacteraeota bacterium]|nr:hydrogenase maturation protease [Candidatus Eremiobacteraeota bacterium]